MTTNAVSVTLGSWMRMTALWASLVTKNSCLRQMMVRLLTSNRGNKRSKKRRIVNKVKRRALSQINNLSLWQTPMPTLRVTDKMMSNRMKEGNLCLPNSHTCRKVVVTRRELLMMIKSRRLVMTSGRNRIDQHKTHRLWKATASPHQTLRAIPWVASFRTPSPLSPWAPWLYSCPTESLYLL